MSSLYYFDTSAVVKLYHRELGTDQVEALFAQVNNAVMISELTVVELNSTVARKLRTGEINLDAYEVILKNFAEDCQHRFVIFPLSAAISQKATDLLQKYGKTKALRTLDALHLGACMSVSATEGIIFVCADTRLLEIATLESIQVLNPEVPVERSPE